MQKIEGIDTIYSTALEMMRWSGENEEYRPVQHILLRDDLFFGYLFSGERVCVVWTAENHAFSVRMRNECETTVTSPSSDTVTIPEPTVKHENEKTRLRRAA